MPQQQGAMNMVATTRYDEHATNGSVSTDATRKKSTPFHSNMPKKNVHGLVVVVEVDPATKTGDNFPPLSRVTHHNVAAKLVVPVVDVVWCSVAAQN